MLWATEPKGHPRALVHRMAGDDAGRPSDPVCGVSTDGLFLWAEVEWEAVGRVLRCPVCDQQNRQ